MRGENGGSGFLIFEGCFFCRGLDNFFGPNFPTKLRTEHQSCGIRKAFIGRLERDRKVCEYIAICDGIVVRFCIHLKSGSFQQCYLPKNQRIILSPSSPLGNSFHTDFIWLTKALGDCSCAEAARNSR